MKSPEAVSELSDVEEQEQQDDVLSDEDYPISEDEDEETEFKKTSFASSIGKILKSENNSEKTLVLSKAKKTADLEKKKKKSGDFQIVGDDGKTEESEEKPGEEELKRALQKKLYQERKKNREKINSLRVKPTYADLDRERTFRKIATRGVVQLFNSVRNQQVEIGRKLSTTKLESKRDEIIHDAKNKKQFLDRLMSAKSVPVDRPIKKEKKKVKKEESDEESTDEEVVKKSWSALKDNFMTSKNTGWDKEDSSDDGDQEMESDSE